MFEFLSSPFGLVAVGLGVLAVAVLALCLWITTLDRRMRGMADGLEAERRKVAEMQMVIGRRSNAARSYGGNRSRPAPAAPQAPVAQPPAAAPQARAAMTSPAAPAPHMPVSAPQARAAAQAQAAYAAASRPAAARAPQPDAPSRRRPAAWNAQEVGPISDAVDDWLQANPGAAAKPIVMPEKKMSRKARREAERAFAARAAAELEARQARRAAQASSVQAAAARPGVRPYGGPAAPTMGSHAPAPVPGVRPVARGGSGFPQDYVSPGVPSGSVPRRGRHSAR